ncbi:hypothetical protein [Halogranum amylolyticum]|nr:hypothetical protein [Halogranum amylolyticum]
MLLEAGGLGTVYSDMVSNFSSDAPTLLSMANFSSIKDFFLSYALELGV